MEKFNDEKMSKANIGNFIIGFGKYKGEKFCNADKKYLKWLNEKNFFENDQYRWNKYIKNYIEKL
jgi:uncharacterized protein (DUF3820 family)